LSNLVVLGRRENRKKKKKKKFDKIAKGPYPANQELKALLRTIRLMQSGKGGADANKRSYLGEKCARTVFGTPG